MERNILDSGMLKQMKGMVEEYKFGLMVVDMKDIGRETKQMVEED